MTEFHDRVALVTGGASGIGQAIARALAERGTTVVIADVDAEGSARTVASIEASGGRARAVGLDVRDRSAFRAVVADVLEREGGLDFFFNNAGIAILGEALAMSDDDWDRMLEINIRGVTNGIQAVYPEMVKRGRGHIVNTASLAGLTPQPGLTAYAAAKHAVVGLSTSLRVEAARHGVRVSVLCPGAIRTPIVENMKVLEEERFGSRERLVEKLPFRLGTADQVARTVLRGVERDLPIIVVTAHAHIAWRAWRLTPSAVLAFSSMMAKRFDALKR